MAEHTSSYSHPYLAFLGTLILGACIGAFGMSILDASTNEGALAVEIVSDEKNLREQDTNFKFISPLLTCGIEAELTSTKKVVALRDQLESLIQKKQEERILTDAGVYVRELNDGAWFGIGETKTFTPGSLLKVPLAMSLFKKMEVDPTFAHNAVEYAGGAPDIPQVYPPLETVEKGKTYTFDQLLRLSVIYSDNVATLLLSQLIDRPTLNEAYSDLGIETPADGDSYTTTVRTYASFFRILFNGTYLTHENSEYLLSLLAQSTFKDGIVAGLPAGIAVAHKFGERERDATSATQLHDCGIVYAPGNPYIVCVMLRGNDMQKLPAVIADISRIVYETLAHTQ